MKHSAKKSRGNKMQLAVTAVFVFLFSFVSFTNNIIDIASAEATTSTAGSLIGGANGNSAQTIDISFDSYPRLSPIVVDDIIYLPTQLPIKFNWPVGSVHTFGVLSEHVSEGSGSRYAFDRWNDFNEDTKRIIRVPSSLDEREFIAIFKQQHLLTVVSDYGIPIGAGWYNSGEIATMSLSDNQIIADIEPGKTRAVFTGWSIGQNPTNPTNAIEMTRPIVATAGWKVQHWFTVESEIDNVKGSGWYDEGTDMKLRAVESIENQDEGVKYNFDQWEVLTSDYATIIDNPFAPTATVKVDAPHIIKAHWSKMFNVRVNSEVGNPVGQGYYNTGDTVRLSVDPYYETVPEKVRLAFAGWQETDSVYSGESGPVQTNSISIKVEDSPVTLTPIWTKQYFVNVNSVYGDIQGSGWYDEGRSVTISSPVTQVNTGFGKLARFDGFVVLNPSETLLKTSTATSTNSMSSSYTIETIDRPYEIKAIWQADDIMQYIIIGLVSVTIAGSFGALMINKRKAAQRLV